MSNQSLETIIMTSNSFSEQDTSFQQSTYKILSKGLRKKKPKEILKERLEKLLRNDIIIFIKNSQDKILGCLLGYRDNDKYIPYCVGTANQKGQTDDIHKKLIEVLQTQNK